MTNGKIRVQSFEMANVVLTILTDNRPCQGIPHNSLPAVGRVASLPQITRSTAVALHFEELARYLVAQETVQIFLDIDKGGRYDTYEHCSLFWPNLAGTSS